MSDSKVEILQKELECKESELYHSKKQYKGMSQALINLEAEYSNIKSLYNSISSKDAYYKSLEAKAHEKDEEIFKLSLELEIMDTVFQRYKLENECQYKKEIGQLKYHNDNNLVKLENAARIEKLLPVVLDQVLDLQNIINTYEVSEKKRNREREIEFEKELSDLKKKMLAYIREGQKSNRNKDFQRQDLYNKLNQFNHSELLKELEYQSNEIETLLKQRECLEKTNRELRHDLEIHFELEKVLKEKNNKYSEIIKSMSMKAINQKEELLFQRNKHNSNSSSNYSNSQNTKSHLSHSFSMRLRNKTPISKDKKLNQLLLKQTKHKISNPIDSNTLKFAPKLHYKKVLDNSKLDYDTLLFKYEAIQAKLEGMETRYKNIYLIFNEALGRLYNDPNLQKIKEIYVNMDDFNSCRFENMSTEQKYSVLVMLINFILPLVNREIIDSEIHRRSIEKVQRKFLLNKADPSRSCSSFQDTHTSLNSFKFTGYKSLKNVFSLNAKNDLNGNLNKPYSVLKMNIPN